MHYTLLRSNSVVIANKIFKNASTRLLSAQASTKIIENELIKEDSEWLSAKRYDEIPGPSKWTFALSFLPGGELRGLSLIDLHKLFLKKYGQIVRVPGVFNLPDMVFTFNPDDFEKVYRTEGMWPIRLGLASFDYYRKELRPDIFKGIGGLVTEQGEPWAKIRTAVNPILMKPQTVKYHLPEIDAVAIDFIDRISQIRDPTTKRVPKTFNQEINNWGFESVCSIALDKRLGLITAENSDPNVERLVTAVKTFFQLSYELDVLPSIWKYYETPKFKKLIATYDDMTNISSKYIEDAMKRAEERERQGNEASKGVVDQLLKIDRQVAMVMAMDMLMAGIDTTSSALIGVLYRLATNPDKQERLRKEIFEILPNKDTPLTKENTKNMPYLRACIKESLRIIPITPGNFRMSGQDLVLSGYQIPKGTGVLMAAMLLSNDDKYFAKSNEFLPERWLKNTTEGCPHLKSNHPFIYLPFGFGSRACIGKRIAEMEIETLTARIMRNYRISWHGDDLKFTSNLIIAPIGDLNFKFEDLQ